MLDFSRWKIASIVSACLLFMLFALPNALPEAWRGKLPSWMPSKTVHLGLDLQGGSHLLLQVDFDAYLKEHLTNTLDGARLELRKRRAGYQGLKVEGNAIRLSLVEREGAEPVDINSVARTVDTALSVRETAPKEYELYYNDASLANTRRQLMDQSMEIVDRRVNATGTTEPIIQRQGDDRIILQAPGRSNPEELKRMLGKTAKMTFHLVNEEVEYSDLMAGRVPPGTRIAEETDSRHGGAGKIAIFSRSVLSGDMLVNSSPAFDENGLPAVGFQFNSVGATRFAEITRSNTGKRFAILLDDKVITAPVINTPIMGGSGIITGNFTTQSANELSILLRAGALPAPLKIIEERSVGPGLGNDSIEAGKNASLLGVVLVMLLMLACYGLFGLFANLAMLMNLVIIMAALSLFEATLTLPGIAGMVLTLGMAVDANVLIYERMREETRMGKTPFAAVDSGFRIAFATIVDTHLTTLLAAFVLFYFGTGTVKGFAVTLIIGLIASLFTAVLITRMMIALWMKRYRPKKLPL